MSANARSPASEPEADLAAILVTDSDTVTIQKTLRRLAAQTLAQRMEVVIAASDPSRIDVAPALQARFARLRLLAADVSTSARGRAAAIRAARAPVVAFVEDHSFPGTDDWAARIIEGHRRPVAALGPRMVNANPATAQSWAIFAIEYGPWLSGDTPSDVAYVPGHNSSYKRDALMALDNRLEDLLESEYTLHDHLRQKGLRLQFDPSMRIEHLNHSRPGIGVPLHFLAGRVFAATRAQSWPITRRLAYALACPLIPPLRFARAMRDLFKLRGNPWLALYAAPQAALILLASGLGEGLGYAFGAKHAQLALTELELNRRRFLHADEQHLAL